MNTALTSASLGWDDVAVRLILALALGSLIGLQRELDNKDAGARTHMLLALGASIFGVVSVGGFDEFIAVRSSTNVVVDVSRVASYVAPGVGFLCGGTILKRREGVQGLTTAGSLWVVAAAGLACGVGLIEVALIGAVLSFLTLIADRPLSWLANHMSTREAPDGAPSKAERAVDDRVGEPIDD